MPNYCYNKLTIECTEQDKSKKNFNDFIETNLISYKDKNTKELTFNGLAAKPDNYIPDKNLRKKYDKNDPNWYIWKNENWGTKWNAITNNIKIEKNKIVIFYETAWTPATKWMNIVAKTYKYLNFKFFGYDEQGLFDCKGHVVNHKWNWKVNEPSKLFDK